MIRTLHRNRNCRQPVVHRADVILCKDRADPGTLRTCHHRCYDCPQSDIWRNFNGGCAMRLLIEIAAATLLVICITDTRRGLRSRQDRPQRRRPDLQLQRGAERHPGRPLRRDQAAMRGQVLRECMRRQTAVGCELSRSRGPQGGPSICARRPASNTLYFQAGGARRAYREHRGDTDFQGLTSALQNQLPRGAGTFHIEAIFRAGPLTSFSGPNCFWGRDFMRDRSFMERRRPTQIVARGDVCRWHRNKLRTF